MSNANLEATPPAPAATASVPVTAPPTSKKSKPGSSPTARKLTQKLSSLHPNASLESRQTIASWIIFNRKKADGLAEGILLSVKKEADSTDVDEGASRLLLLLRITHQVLVSNSSLASAAGEENGNDGGADPDSEEVWEKSSQLRITLGEVALRPLLDALANCLNKVGESNAFYNQCGCEVKEMMDAWKKCNVFGGPTVVEEYRKGWISALSTKKRETGTDSQGPNEVGKGIMDNDDATDRQDNISGKLDNNASGGVGEQELQNSDHLPRSNTNTTDIKREPQNEQKPEVKKTDGKDIKIANSDANITEIHDTTSEANAAGDNADTPKAMAAESEQNVKSSQDDVHNSSDEKPPKKELVIDFEGVEEAKVEPSQLLEAAKIISSLQITRDLGSDAAMNLSSVLSTIPHDVEEACTTIVQQQGQDENIVTNLADLLADDSLNNLPDELLDLDLQYARQSLHTYKETIRQQRKARMQCLKLLLQSRFRFGSLDAARMFGCGDIGDGVDDVKGGDSGNTNMAVILDKLRKRKDALSDAMALEGLDVEENAEEQKKLDMKEGEGSELLSWFALDDGSSNTTEERETKKVKLSPESSH